MDDRVREHLDSMVEKAKQSLAGREFMGVPIKDMDRGQLLVCIDWLIAFNHVNNPLPLHDDVETVRPSA